MERLDDLHTITGRVHPHTSFAAADLAYPRTGTARRRVLDALAEEARTDEEIQDVLAMSPNTERPRRVELVRGGWVIDSGLRRRTVTGARSIVWTLTPVGRAAVERRTIQ